MKRITAIALVLIIVLFLVSCASSGDGSVSGTYKLYALDYDEGHAVLADEFFSGENYVLLKDGGKAESKGSHLDSERSYGCSSSAPDLFRSCRGKSIAAGK